MEVIIKSKYNIGDKVELCSIGFTTEAIVSTVYYDRYERDFLYDFYDMYFSRYERSL